MPVLGGVGSGMGRVTWRQGIYSERRYCVSRAGLTAYRRVEVQLEVRVEAGLALRRDKDVKWQAHWVHPGWRWHPGIARGLSACTEAMRRCGQLHAVRAQVLAPCGGRADGMRDGGASCC